MLVLASLALAAAPAPALPGTLRIYLARHGQTDWNAARRLQGRTDTHLDSTGRAQAAALGRRLEGVRLDAVVSSRLSRTRETAAIVHGRVPIDSLAGLDERNLGAFQGFVQGSDSARTAEYNRRRKQLGDDLDGGETLEEHLGRVSAALDQIRRRHRSGNVLIVGHGLTNQLVLRVLLGLRWDQALSIDQGNDELYLVEIDSGHAPRLWKWIGPERVAEL